MGRTVCCALALALAACNRAHSDQLPALSPATPVAAPATPGEQAVITASRGKVELLRGPDGAWSQVHVGDRLGERDALRTDSGEADVSIEGVKVRLHESSRLQIENVGKKRLAAKVAGSIESEVEPEQQARLDVHFEGSDAAAHSEGGHSFLTGDGRGVVAVAAVTGSVHLSSSGKDVEVKKGEVSRVATAKEPSPPAAALRRVLLSVQWPKEHETNKAALPIAGSVEPGSHVFVQGQPVTVEAGGAFRTEVPLKKGKQKVSVLTIDALGRRRQVENVVLRDDSLPDVKVKKKLWQWR